MPNGRQSKQNGTKDHKATVTPRSTKKKVKSAPSAELSPERRVEIAQQIKAKEFRGKPPSI